VVAPMDLPFTKPSGNSAMATRPDPPVGIFDSISGQWMLTTAWVCEMSDGRALLVHPGILSDGASIPPILWPFVGPRYAAQTFSAAFFHDCAYMSEIIPRHYADDEFRRLLVLHGVSATKARMYWLAVRLFGGFVWRRHSAGSIAAARMFVEIIA
jgi:hypothetical protein